MISVETRGAAQPSEMVNGAPVVHDLGIKPWEFMIGIINDAGANSPPGTSARRCGSPTQKETLTLALQPGGGFVGRFSTASDQ